MATILVVDDLAANRTLLTTILRYHGHRLLEAEHGVEALATIRAEPPDLVITDVLMPEMDGYELVRQLRADSSTAQIPVVFCTAQYGEREAKTLALSYGVSDVITKPIEVRTLLAIVDRVLSGASVAGTPFEAGPIEGAFDREHLRLMTNKLSETEADLRAANARLRAVINIGLELASERNSERLLEHVCAATRDLFGATYVTVGILDRTAQTIQRVFSSGTEMPTSVKRGGIAPGIFGAVMAERRTRRGENRDGNPVNLQLPPLHPRVQAFIVAPIASPAHVYGWICLVGNEGRTFTEEDESLVTALGGQVGRIYENGHLGQHDFLTDLPNRMLLNDRVSQAIALAQRNHHRIAVLFVDLDRFKRVNDSLGHAIGDLLLQSVGRRLVACVRNSDTVSRPGGDEFVVLLSGVQSAANAAFVARKIIAALVAPHEVAQHTLHLSSAIGISVYPEDGTDAAALLRCADIAMYAAKKTGPGTCRFFEPEMDARAIERQRIEAALRQGLAEREFVLHYQPRIDLESGVVTGAEALIRWMHPERGLMLPLDFVPIAEDCGLIVPIGEWVLAEACAQVRTWIAEGRRPIPVAVNISALEFQDTQFLNRISATLRDSELDPRYLELELTESSLMQDVASARLALHGLKDIGVQVAIDDFGTGYSSLSYLRQFPTSVIKIDQSFIHEISADPVGISIVSAMISMGKNLGQRLIAEGVETREQLEFLRAQHCEEAQGYYFSRPLAADRFVALLETMLPGPVLQ